MVNVSQGVFLRIRNCGGIFGGGGSFRSGVQPPTGTDGEVQAPTGTGTDGEVQAPTGNGIRGEAQGRFSGFGIVADIWRGWIVPVGGLTPDRHRWGGSSTDWHWHRSALVGGGGGVNFWRRRRNLLPSCALFGSRRRRREGCPRLKGPKSGSLFQNRVSRESECEG